MAFFKTEAWVSPHLWKQSHYSHVSIKHDSPSSSWRESQTPAQAKVSSCRANAASPAVPGTVRASKSFGPRSALSTAKMLQPGWQVLDPDRRHTVMARCPLKAKPLSKIEDITSASLIAVPLQNLSLIAVPWWGPPHRKTFRHPGGAMTGAV